jgi:hypothetical protein
MVVVAAFAGGGPLRQTVAHADTGRGPGEQIELRDVARSTGHREVIDHAVPFLHGVRLGDAALYRLAGREDLARRYELRWRLGGAIGLTGLAALVGGIIVVFTAPTHEVCAHGRCEQEVYGPRAVVGFAMAGLMPVLGGVAYLVSPTPLSREEKSTMVDVYNASEAAPRDSPLDGGVRAAPVVLPGGAGVGLRGTF